MASRVRNIWPVPWAAEHGGNAHEVNVRRQFFDPWVDDRLERIAMRATVPEQFHHFDLARHSHRNGVGQLDVRGLRFLGVGLGSHAEQAGGDERGADDQITHALLLDNEVASRDLFLRQTVAGSSSLV
jgi:hypothetical protein